jgi:hypothetical protein
VADPAGDDHGPDGRTRYPTTRAGANRQMDLQARARLDGRAAPCAWTCDAPADTSWNPANGFDHVAFTIFIELPGEPGGARVMPGRTPRCRPGMRWHRRLRLHGWSNACSGRWRQRDERGPGRHAGGRPAGRRRDATPCS